VGDESQHRLAEACRRVLAAGFPASMILEAQRQAEGMADDDLVLAEVAARALSEEVTMERRRRRPR
jgi:hypothetical protein